MAELTQRQMLVTLVEDVKHIKGKQDCIDKKLANIDIELTGTSYDKSKGIVPRLNKAEISIINMKRKQAKIVIWGFAIFGCINIIGVIVIIVNNIIG